MASENHPTETSSISDLDLLFSIVAFQCFESTPKVSSGQLRKKQDREEQEDGEISE
jgi:hypothetical protein